jgi:hypothetical protein
VADVSLVDTDDVDEEELCDELVIDVLELVLLLDDAWSKVALVKTELVVSIVVVEDVVDAVVNVMVFVWAVLVVMTGGGLLVVDTVVTEDWVVETKVVVMAVVVTVVVTGGGGAEEDCDETVEVVDVVGCAPG